MDPGQSGQGPIPVVRVIARDARDRVLLLRRASGQQGEGGWCLPGGKIDYGETAMQAATRELSEETALEGSGVRYLFYQDSVATEVGSMHCVNLYFACTVMGDPLLNEESSDSAWITPSDLDRYEVVFRNDEGLRRYWSSG